MNNIFIIGAQRSGSTYLLSVLKDHPEISANIKINPEPKFFLSKKIKKKDINNYEKLYFNKTTKKTKYLCEKSTSYIEHSYALKKIKKIYPNCKIIVILRNPALRAYSNYRFSVTNNLEKKNFIKALKSENSRTENMHFTTSVNPFIYKKRGLYNNYLREIFDIFNELQVKILIYEEFLENLIEIKNLFKWLEIDSDYVPKLYQEKVNNNINNFHNDKETINKLFDEYKESILDLETLIHKKIKVWHKLT
tara:strand:+ start:470 stop:1219 length:750 start_codon:yes stop_codon:yes gene_type:complete